MRYTILRKFRSDAGLHEPGEVVDLPENRNVALLVDQRYIVLAPPAENDETPPKRGPGRPPKA